MSKISFGLLVLAICVFTGMRMGLEAQQCTACNSEPYTMLKCHNQLWFDAEYLYWKIKDAPAPVPLLTSGPVVPSFAPVLDTPGTEVVLGGKQVKNDWRSGGRFALGYWYEEEHCIGWDLDYFFVLGDSWEKTVSSDGSLGTPLLASPFFDVTTGQESSIGVARPGSFAGLAKLKLSNDMQGAELNGVMRVWSNCSAKINILAGFRYWNFEERLTFFTSSPFIAFPDDVYNTKDRFHAKNNFFGGQLGIDLNYNGSCFFMNAKGKLALGAMCEDINIRGKLLTNDFTNFEEVEHFEGGYFALPTNIGHHNRTKFAVIPEANVNFGYKLTERFHLKVGYTFLYVNNVLRASNQINRNINPSQSVAILTTPYVELVGEASPKVLHKNTSFWVQGVNAGFEFHF